MDLNMFKQIRRILRNLRKVDDLAAMMPLIENIQAELDAVRSRIDVEDALFDRFQAERKSKSYQEVFDKESPLVSICICTYNRGHLLVERSIQSILSQDYDNFEIVVVGDCCTDATAKMLADLKEERIRYVNLTERCAYPDDPMLRWMVAGAPALNHAFDLVRGDFITQLDDDDEYAPGRIQKMIQFIQESRADFVWHPFWAEDSSGNWYLNESKEFKKGQVTTSSIFYHNWFKQIRADIHAFKFLEPGDWNRLRKIKYLGAKTARYPEPLLKHYREQNQNKS